MNETTKLIINIYHETEKDNYTVRDEAGQKIIGFTTIQHVDDWLKLSNGSFITGPKETEAGWIREAAIPVWAYQKLAPRQLEKAA